jgi:hypothetical protein
MSAVVPAAVTTVVAVLTLMTGTALASSKAHDSGQKAKASHSTTAHKAAAKPKHKAKPKPKPKVVELTGVLTDTPTATIGVAAADTATATITMAVKGGERRMHRTVVTLTLTSATVIRRGDRRATAADLRKGDHLSVKARRLADGSWLALRVNAAAPRPPKVAKPDDGD